MQKIEPAGGFLYIYLLAAFLLCLAVYSALLGLVSRDEIEAVHTAWKMLNGEVIYRDFFQHHHLLLYYLLIPLIKFGGESIVTFYLAEAFAFLIFAAIVVTTFFLAEKMYEDRKTSWLAVILLLTFPFFIAKGTHIRPDPLQILFGLWAVYFLAGYLSAGGQEKRLVLSAFLLSLSFLTLQKAVFLVFAVVLFLLYCLFKAGRKITRKDFFLYWAVFSALPALYAVFLLATGGWQNYFDFNWLLNMKFQLRPSPFKNFSLDVSNERFLITLILAGHVSLFMYGVGCSFRAGKIDGLHGFVILAGFVLAASLLLVRAPHPHYFLQAAPFVAMVAASSLRRLFSERAAKAGLTVFALFWALILVIHTGSGLDKKRTLSELRYVLSVSEPEDSFFGYTINLFRKDASFFWFCMKPKACVDTYRGFRDYDFDPVRIIKETRPKVIHAPGSHQGFYTAIIKHPEVASDYERSPKYSDIYIRKDRR